MSNKMDISELKSGLPWYEPVDPIDSSELTHYGTPRHSGRYPWGSGDNPYQHAAYFRQVYTRLKKEGKTEKEMAEYFNMSINELRARNSNAKAEVDAANYRQVMKMKDKGMSNTAIAKVMGINESSVRSMINTYEKHKFEKNQQIAQGLADAIDSKGMIDIGSGVAESLGITEDRLKKSVAILKDKGYVQQNIYIEQATNPGQYTTIKVLAPPGTDKKDILANKYDVASATDLHREVDPNGKETIYDFEPPQSIDSSRIYVRYAEEGGKDRDGMIQLRRDVKDLSLGDDLYAQVRIAVDGTNYMKGIAVYSDDIPEGYDVVYNSNKSRGTPLFDAPKGYETVFKKMKTIKDPDTGEDVINNENPFGSMIKQKDGQYHYDDDDGNKQLGAINKIRGEGEWDEWSKTLPSQFLAKQSKELIDKQLTATFADKRAEYDEICSLENPQIKKKLLLEFADGCDSAAVDLKARSLPGQAVKVILADPNVKDNEVYAPQYPDGTQLALVRYPHQGIFEIPICKVNNNIESAKKMLGDGKDVAIDAIVINSKTAGQLSGADFDGDTVTCIPTHGNNGVKISNKAYYEGLKDYDYTEMYKYHEGMEIISKSNMQKQMGVVSNLITDMTIKGATDAELERATKYSMVIIDSYKHKLDYKACYNDNGIAELQKKYQPKEDDPTKGGGASTLFSRAKSQKRINERKEGIYVEDPETGKIKKLTIDPETGEKLYRETGKQTRKLSAAAKKRVQEIKDDPDLDGDEKSLRIRAIYAEEGEDKDVQSVSTKMYEAKDARELSSGTVKENLYADYANNLKSLANQARLEYLDTPDVKRDPDAAKKYSSEVASLNAKLDQALMNAPKERQAQMLANKRAQEAIAKDPSLKDDTKELKKLKSQLLNKARTEVGANGKESRISISDLEWEAIQNKAISSNLLNQIMAHTDTDKLKERAMPRNNNVSLSAAKVNQIRARAASGYTIAEIADSLGVSTSVVIKYMK